MGKSWKERPGKYRKYFDKKPKRGKNPHIPFKETYPVEMEKEEDEFLQEGLESVH
jgi:hypothetical protein